LALRKTSVDDITTGERGDGEEGKSSVGSGQGVIKRRREKERGPIRRTSEGALD